MTTKTLDQAISFELKTLDEAKMLKKERILCGPQEAKIQLQGGKEALNFSSNNYLGLANHPLVIEAAKESLDRYGYGTASSRFISGTMEPHVELEKKLSAYLGTEDTILYTSCFDANGGLFETILKEEDTIVSDRLNHASIIDGIRLSKAKKALFKSCDMEDLERVLQEHKDSRFLLIATDGVFSMDGKIAPLDEIASLKEKYGAYLMVDDCHGFGFLGDDGSGTIKMKGVTSKVDLITGTLGKALGGAIGGFTSGRKTLIDLLRQKSRPYLFSNALPPFIAAASLRALELVKDPSLRNRLFENVSHFREGIKQLGFTVLGDHHPIVPVMLFEEEIAQVFEEQMQKRGIYVISFSYPVVPKKCARIRVQISSSHTKEMLDQCLDAFKEVGTKLGVISSSMV